MLVKPCYMPCGIGIVEMLRAAVLASSVEARVLTPGRGLYS